jgi:hypothetical protein
MAKGLTSLETEQPHVPTMHPYGLCISLSEVELEKLGLDDDVDRGDMLHLRIMVKATSIHKYEGGCRIECAIISGKVEDEDTEA